MPGFVSSARQEFIADLPITALNSQLLLNSANGFSNDRFMYGMILTFEARITNPPGAGAPTSVFPEAPFTLIDNLQIQGYHRVRGANEQFLNMRGSDLYNMVRSYTAVNTFVQPNNPILSAAGIFLPQLTVVADEVNDVRFQLFVPFCPMNHVINEQLNWILDAPNYDRLQMTIQVGDALSVFSGLTAGATGVIGAATATQCGFTAFGSNAGTPRVRVEGQYALAGAGAFNYVPGRVWRYYVENTTGDIVSAATSNSRRYTINRGNKIRGVLVKTGTKATTATATNNVYATLSDDVLNNIKFQRGQNKSIRFYPSYRSISFETSINYGFRPPVGYAIIDFAQHGRIIESLDTIGLVAGPSGDTDTFIQADVSGGANFADLYLVEELRGQPRRI